MIHRLVHLFRDPFSTSQPLYLISIPTSCLINLTSHPASHNFTTNSRECLMDVRRRHHYADCGSYGRFRSQLCAETMVSLSECRTVIEFSVICLLVTGTAEHSKRQLVPESKFTHSFMFSWFTLSVARITLRAGCCVGPCIFARRLLATKMYL